LRHCCQSLLRRQSHQTVAGRVHRTQAALLPRFVPWIQWECVEQEQLLGTKRVVRCKPKGCRRSLCRGAAAPVYPPGARWRRMALGRDLLTLPPQCLREVMSGGVVVRLVASLLLLLLLLLLLRGACLPQWACTSCMSSSPERGPASSARASPTR
jgi:hypothetical protein